jgi:UPF0755 protein
MSPPPVKIRRAKVRRRKAREGSEEVAVTAPPEPRTMGLVKWTFGVLLLLAAVLLGLLLFVYPTADGPGSGATVEVDVPAGITPDALADLLVSRDAVGNRRLFALYVRVRGGTDKVVAGHHLLTDALSPRELMARLERKGQAHVRVTIPEGWNRFDIARRLDSSRVCTLRAFLDASEDAGLMKELLVDGPSFEGYLFPATYDLDADADARDIVRTLFTEFERRYSSLEDKNQSGVKDLADSLGWGRKQIVILASMIEKEAAVDDERPIIASVFLNRLRDPAFSPKLLQCDPTAGYGCLVGTSAGCRAYTGKITHEVVADPDNAYNTYKHVGLPPGPIANPGEKSLAAAMSPSLTRYLYFVAKGGGRHTFSESYAAHSSAVHEDKSDAGP